MTPATAVSVSASSGSRVHMLSSMPVDRCDITNASPPFGKSGGRSTGASPGDGVVSAGVVETVDDGTVVSVSSSGAVVPALGAGVSVVTVTVSTEASSASPQPTTAAGEREGRRADRHTM